MIRSNIYRLILKVVNMLFWINIGIAIEWKNLEETTLKPVVKFSEVWLSTPKQYIFVAFPISYPAKSIYKSMSQIQEKATRNMYFRYGYDVSNINSTKHYQNELLWFPLNLESYNSNCQNFGLISESIMKKKHIIFHVADIDTAVYLFESCFIQFDYKLVLYYSKNVSDSHLIVFEELYKINPQEKKIYRNVLYQFNTDSGQKESDVFIDFIWKRRSNLHGAIFQGVTEIYPPFINHIEKGNDSTAISCEGYLCSILDHLQSHLNFSIIANIPTERHSWSFLVKEVQKEIFDIGVTGFIFNPSRNKRVDFSFGVLPLSYTSIYIYNRIKRVLGLFYFVTLQQLLLVLPLLLSYSENVEICHVGWNRPNFFKSLLISVYVLLSVEELMKSQRAIQEKLRSYS